MTAKLTPATVRAMLEMATKGPWGFRGLRDHEWSVDTDGNNSVQFIGPKGKLPVCAAIVNAAFGKDHILDANAALIASAPDLAAAYLEALAVIEEIAGTEWQEMEPSSGWIPDGAEGYVGEMESFCNWATERARAFIAKHKEQEA